MKCQICKAAVPPGGGDTYRPKRGRPILVCRPSPFERSLGLRSACWHQAHSMTRPDVGLARVGSAKVPAPEWVIST